MFKTPGGKYITVIVDTYYICKPIPIFPTKYNVYYGKTPDTLQFLYSINDYELSTSEVFLTDEQLQWIVEYVLEYD